MTACLDHQLDEAMCVEVDKRTRHVLEGERAAVRFDTGTACLLFTQTHGSDLRVGENRRWHNCQVQRRMAASHVDRRACAGRRCHINEPGLVSAVASGVDVRDVSAHAGVDFDGTLFVDRNSRGFEAEAARVGFAACSNQQSISASFTVICHQHELAIHRSEEHTSELQSLMRISYAVFCLKKKTIKLPAIDAHDICTPPRSADRTTTRY